MTVRTLILAAVLLLTAAILAVPASARADSAFWLGGTLSSAHVSGTASSSSPTLIGGSLSATLGYVFGDHFLLGATTSYEWINQYSDSAPPVGNWRGSRLDPVAPTAAFLIGPVTLQGDYELLGNYNLSTAAADNSSVSYTGPSGYAISLTCAIMNGFNVGFLYRNLSFTTQSSSSGGSTTLQTKFGLTDYGLTATFALYPRATGGQ